MKRLASALVAAVAGAPVVAHARPPRPSIHREAEAAVKACKPYRQHLRDAEKAHKLPAKTLEALVYKESRCNPKAHNKRTKARGLGQHVPSGAAAVGRIQRAKGQPAPWFTYAKTLDPVASIRAAAELLSYSLEVCGSLAEAITVYNRGGRCGKPNAFSRAVLRLAEAIRFVAGEEPRT